MCSIFHYRRDEKAIRLVIRRRINLTHNFWLGVGNNTIFIGRGTRLIGNEINIPIDSIDDDVEATGNRREAVRLAFECHGTKWWGISILMTLRLATGLFMQILHWGEVFRLPVNDLNRIQKGKLNSFTLSRSDLENSRIRFDMSAWDLGFNVDSKFGAG